MGGIACGTDSAIVVLLARPDIFHVKDHFRRNNLSATLVEEKANSKSAWYGIVDGNCRHQAIVLLTDKDPALSSFSRTIIVVRSGLPMERCRQLPNMQNTKNTPLFYVDYIFAGVLFNL